MENIADIINHGFIRLLKRQSRKAIRKLLVLEMAEEGYRVVTYSVNRDTDKFLKMIRRTLKK